MFHDPEWNDLVRAGLATLLVVGAALTVVGLWGRV